MIAGRSTNLKNRLIILPTHQVHSGGAEAAWNRPVPSSEGHSHEDTPNREEVVVHHLQGLLQPVEQGAGEGVV